MTARYSLVRASIRNIIDLRGFEVIIKDAYKYVNSKLIITVCEKYYEVNGALTRGQAIAAGRIIASSSLGQYVVKYPIGSKTHSTCQLFRKKK
jgi:hypothetical protein